VPMVLLALLFLVVLVLPLLVGLPAEATARLDLAGAVVWLLFAVELGLKTYLAPDRRQFLASRWYDVLIVAFPILRPLRVFWQPPVGPASAMRRGTS